MNHLVPLFLVSQNNNNGGGADGNNNNGGAGAAAGGVGGAGQRQGMQSVSLAQAMGNVVSKNDKNKPELEVPVKRVGGTPRF